MLTIPSLNLNNADVVCTNSIKYLGVVINNDFTDDGDITHQLRCLYASNIILSKFAYCFQKVKLLLLELYCLHLYCSAIWCDYSRVGVIVISNHNRL